MEKETEQNLNYLTLGQSDLFGNGNEGTIGDLIGRFCNPQDISPLTNLQSLIYGGIRFDSYTEQFGSSDRVIGSLLDPDSVSDRADVAARSNPKKRKSRIESPASSSLTASNSKVSVDNGGSKAVKRSKQEVEARSNKNIVEKRENNDDDSKPPEPFKDYIHVRARRGQATDSHSLAERARREKISERMTLLQDLVPGCNRITGKAVMLDEIINYVQSLQRQVEFLSMKLATINPRMEFNTNTALSTEMIQPMEFLSQSLYAIASSEQRVYYSLGKNMPRFLDTHSSDGFVQTETQGLWENDLQSIVHQQSNNNCYEQTILHMKLEP
ncbi:unnamed protein product [Cochlearia groenlandica]